MSKVTTRLRDRDGFIIFIFCLAIFISIVDRAVISMNVPSIQEDLKLNEAAMGMVLSIFFVGYVLMQIPSGMLVDRLGAKKMILLALISWSIFTSLTGLAWSLVSILIIRLLFGIAEGGLPPASAKSVAEYFELSKRPRITGIYRSVDIIGIALAPLVASPLILWLGWRNMFITIGIIGLIVAVFIWYFLKNPPQEQTDQKEQVNKIPLRELAKISVVWKLGLAWFGTCIVAWGYTSWVPTYLMKVRHLKLMEATYVIAFGSLLAVGVTILGGWLVGKYFKRNGLYILAISNLLGAASLYLMFSSTSLALALTGQIMTAIFLQLGNGGLWALLHKIIPAKAIGSAAGMINFIGQIGGILAPSTMGFLITAMNAFIMELSPS